MAGSASLPGIVTYCHAPPAPHSRTASPPIEARPLCKYRVTARAPACSRQGPITPATNPSHRLVKIVHFPSFLFPPLSLSSCFDFILFFSLSSLCIFYLPPSIFPVSLFSLSPFLSFSLSACWESGRALHAVYSTDTCHICPLPNSPLPINTLVSAAFLLLYLYTWRARFVVFHHGYHLERFLLHLPPRPTAVNITMVGTGS